MTDYTIKNELNGYENTDKLQERFGNTWEKALNKLESKHDGYVMTIHTMEGDLRIYRTLNKSYIVNGRGNE